MARRRVRPGGHRLQERRRGPHPPDRLRHRARRRGRQDHLLRQRHRAAHERHLRRRHGRLPDASGLNELAKGAEHIYPIASRCGVFAKSDVQPLLNEGAARADVAASIFQAVANQTISGLACGHPIRGYVAFLGGPLQYLSELRDRFYKTLKLDEDHRLIPENAHLFVATGAALAGESDKYVTFAEVIRDLDNLGDTQGSEVERLDPLFETEADYEAFKARHDKEVVEKGSLDDYHGRVYMGIDAGSTTMKAAVVGEDGQLLYTWYGNNNGDVLGTARTIMNDIYDHLNDDCEIGHVTTTGYGEGILIEALGADSGEIETVAHLRGAKAFVPDVNFILDIGGQDMKCLQVKGGIIEHISLNEACSSGCGSFIANFADSMGMDVREFAAAAVRGERPVDLGSRCTVFMNSRVKQAQKEGATIGDVAAGLSYSVIKNALFKVIKLRDYDEIGKYVVVQGGTFMSDATLRAFELLTGREVIRPDIAGVMGAYGAALLARDRAGAAGTSNLLSRDEINNLEVKHTNAHCGRCSNNCLLTINSFGNGRRFITGNRCEKGSGKPKSEQSQAPNLFKFKNRLLFEREGLSADEAPRGTVGIPRALNMYENFPFWHAFFTKLGFSVVLSDPTTRKTYEAGTESMPSESVCYPAKLSHGHIMNLLEKDTDFIWMPCIRWERQEDETAGNHYNCPIVMSYPQALGLNVDELADPTVEFIDAFIPYDKKSELKRRLFELVQVKRREDAAAGKGRFKGDDITRAEVDEAVNVAWEADLEFKEQMRRKGDEVLQWIEDNDAHGIVLAGRPYHNDGEINHAIPEMLQGFGFAVLTEDSVAHKMSPERPIRVVDQWMYHSRLYRAARFVATRNDLDLIQLQSFGCGLDALTTDQVQEILEASGKIYTVLKIDEVSNLGAARIRVRSLMAALKEERAQLERQTAAGTAVEVMPDEVRLADGSLEHARATDLSRRPPVYRAAKSAAFKKVRYTKKMQEEGYTILAPQMSPIHFEIVEALLRSVGYNVVLLPSVDHAAVDTGLKYVNNDICYPSILVTGQIMEAVLSGKYDLERTAVLISQTGGGCRATNYIALIRKALKDSGHENVPVISLSVAGGLDEDNPGFKLLQPGLIKRAVYALLYGDLIMKCLYRTRPYEAEAGSADRLYESFMSRAKTLIPRTNRKAFYELCEDTVKRFDALPLVPPDGQQRGRQGHRGRGLRGRRPGPRGLLPVRHVQPAQHEGRAGHQEDEPPHARRGHQAHRGHARPDQQDAGALRALRALRQHLRAGREGREGPLPLQHDGRGLAAHGRDDRPHRARHAQHRVRVALRLPAQPRRGQVGHQAPAPDAPREQHRRGRLRPRRLRGQPAEPHQAHDLGRQGELQERRRLQDREPGRPDRGRGCRDLWLRSRLRHRRAFHHALARAARADRAGQAQGGREVVTRLHATSGV